MLGNIACVVILLAWAGAVLVYFTRRKRAAKASGCKACVGCPCAGQCEKAVHEK